MPLLLLPWLMHLKRYAALYGRQQQVMLKHRCGVCRYLASWRSFSILPSPASGWEPEVDSRAWFPGKVLIIDASLGWSLVLQTFRTKQVVHHWQNALSCEWLLLNWSSEGYVQDLGMIFWIKCFQHLLNFIMLKWCFLFPWVEKTGGFTPWIKLEYLHLE